MFNCLTISTDFAISLLIRFVRALPSPNKLAMPSPIPANTSTTPFTMPNTSPLCALDTAPLIPLPMRARPSIAPLIESLNSKSNVLCRLSRSSANDCKFCPIACNNAAISFACSLNNLVIMLYFCASLSAALSISFNFASLSSSNPNCFASASIAFVLVGSCVFFCSYCFLSVATTFSCTS